MAKKKTNKSNLFLRNSGKSKQGNSRKNGRTRKRSQLHPRGATTTIKTPLESMGIAARESDLEQQLKFYSQTLETISEIVTVTDLQDRFVFVNRAFQEVYGYTREEILGQHIRLIRPKDFPRKLAEIVFSESRKLGWKGEIPNKTKGGREFIISLRTLPIRNVAGEILGLVGIAQDITPQKKAKEDLQRARNQLENIFGSLKEEGFWSYDPREKKVLYNSSSMEKIYGLPLEGFYEDLNLWKKVVHPQDLARVEANEQESLAGNQVSIEYRIVRADGSIRWLDEKTIPVLDENGVVVRLDGILIDITERRRAEDALRESERRFRELIENSADAIAVLSEQGVILYESSSVARVLGYAPEELVGRSIFELLHPNDQSRAVELFGRLIEKPAATVKSEVRYRHKDGRWLWVEGTGKNLLREKNIQAIVMNYRDVTDRRDAEEELRTSETRFRTVVESIGEGLLITDLDDVVLYVNSRLEDFTGYTAAELLGKKAFELLLAPEDWDSLRSRNIQRAHGVAERYEMQLRRKDGTFFWTEINATPYRDPSGTIVGTLGAINDITERKKAEEALRESEQRFKMFMKNLPGAAWMKDLGGRYVYANEEAERVFDISFDKLRGKTDDEIFPRETATQFRSNDEIVLRTGKDLQTMETIPQEDGVHYSIVSKFPIRRPDGKPIFVGGAAMDITGLRRAEEALRQSEERFHQIAENIHEVFWMSDVGMKKVLYISAAYEQIWGRARESLLERPESFLETVLPEDRTKVREFLDNQTRTICEVEYRIVRPEGSVRWIRDRAYPLSDNAGKVSRVTGVAEDITERKEAEEHIRRLNAELERRIEERTAEVVAQKDKIAKANEELNRLVVQLEEARVNAEEANRTKSQFLANISHEIRTPLNSVIGFANVLLKKKQGMSLTEDIEHVERILENAKHLLDVINQILDLSKVEAGKVELEHNQVSLESLIHETIKDLEVQAHEKEIRIQTDIPSQLEMIETDRKKMKQILINLMGNALKFTDRGAVKVHVERNALNSRPVRIDVIDTGIGIPEKLLGEIFEAFRQADNTTKRKYEGTGLGLTISRSLCELLGYELFVKSEEGKGSVFSVFLAPREQSKKR